MIKQMFEMTAPAGAKRVGEEGLKAYVRKVFGYMGISLGITAAVSYALIRTSLFSYLINPATGGLSGLGTLIMWSPLAIVLCMSFVRSMGAKGSKIGLFAIAALEGASVSIIALVAGVHTTFLAFLITSAMFGAMTLWGYLTDKDLTKMGSILMMGVLGLFIVSIVSIFTGALGIWFSYAVVAIFTLLVAYDVQMIKNIYSGVGGKGEVADKLAVMCALSLYLDFLNIFIHLMNIINSKRN